MLQWRCGRLKITSERIKLTSRLTLKLEFNILNSDFFPLTRIFTF